VATHPRRREGKMVKAKRNGKPLTVWLNEDLSNALATASERRKVDKSEIVRVAVKRLLNDLETGQLELPLGI
jgi:metal-responsive CopG/Arc/MetJ family transcriptional regulator